MKFTSLELLKMVGPTFEVGDENIAAADAFGKVRVRIAGIAGIVKADKKISLQPGDYDVIVGVKAYSIKIE